MVEAHQICVLVLFDAIVIVLSLHFHDFEGLSFVVGFEEEVDCPADLPKKDQTAEKGLSDDDKRQ